jgi:hypothetical protein
VDLVLSSLEPSSSPVSLMYSLRGRRLIEALVSIRKVTFKPLGFTVKVFVILSFPVMATAVISPMGDDDDEPFFARHLLAKWFFRLHFLHYFPLAGHDSLFLSCLLPQNLQSISLLVNCYFLGHFFLWLDLNTLFTVGSSLSPTIVLS